MGRYRRGRSLHWMTQPRGLDGRFQRQGGPDDNGLLDMNGFWKLHWWGKILFIVAFMAVTVWMVESLAFVGAALLFVVLIVADKVLDAVLPDEEDEGTED